MSKYNFFKKRSTITYYSIQFTVRSDTYAFDKTFIQRDVVTEIQNNINSNAINTPVGTKLNSNDAYTLISKKKKKKF